MWISTLGIFSVFCSTCELLVSVSFSQRTPTEIGQTDSYAMIWHWTDILITVFISLGSGEKRMYTFATCFSCILCVCVQKKLRQWTEWHLKIPSEAGIIYLNVKMLSIYSYFVAHAMNEPFLQMFQFKSVHWFCGSPAFRCDVIHEIGSVACSPGGCQECSYTFNCITIGSRHNKNSSLKIVRFFPSNQSFEWIE